MDHHVELSCIIADDGEIRGHTMPLQAAKQRALGGNVAVARGIHSQAIQVLLPRALIGKACALMLTQRVQEHVREPLLLFMYASAASLIW